MNREQHWWRRHLLELASVLVLVAVGVVVALIFLGPRTNPIVCPGGGPKWMLDAQDYQGGCSEVLPSDQAPPNADWKWYCGGAPPYPKPSDALCEGI